MEDQRSHFALQNFHGHAKGFLRKLKTIWASALQEVRQLCDRRSNRILVEILLVPNLASGIQKSSPCSSGPLSGYYPETH
jgi:hypothetical protein